MAFRILRQSFAIERRCHAIFRVISRTNATSSLLLHRPATQLFAEKFSKVTNFTRFYKKPTDVNDASPEAVYEVISEQLKSCLLSKTRSSLPAVRKFLKLCIDKGGPTQDETLLLLNSITNCLPNVPSTHKMKLIEQLWSHLPQNLKRIEPVFVSYLQACRSCSVLLDYNALLIELMIKPSPLILQTILSCVAEHGNVEEAKKIVEEMNVRNYPVTETEYAMLIHANGVTKDLKEVDALVEVMASRKIEMTSVAKAELVRAYLRNDKPDEALKVFSASGSAMKEPQLLQVLQTVLNHHPTKEFVTAVLKFFPSDVLEDKEIYAPFQNICIKLIFRRKYDELNTFIECLPAPMFTATDDLDSYAAFALEELLKNNAPMSDIMKFVHLLRNEKRNEFALRVVTGIAMKLVSPMASEFLEKMSKEEKLRTHYFWPLLNYRNLFDGEAGIIQTLVLMKNFNVEVDQDTLKLFVLPKLRLTLNEIEKGAKELDAAGVKMSVLMTPLTLHLMIKSRFDDVVRVNALYPAKLDTKSLISGLSRTFAVALDENTKIPLIAKVIRTFVEKRMEKDHDVAGHLLCAIVSHRMSKAEKRAIIQLLGELSLHGIKVSRNAAETLPQYFESELDEEEKKLYFGNIVDKTLSLPADENVDHSIKHPSKMNLEELECHLTQLQSKNMNIRGCLRRLLQLNIRANRLERAMELKLLCDKNKIEMSPGMLAGCFDMYVRVGRLEEAENTFFTLQTNYPTFIIDSHKIVDFAQMLVKEGKFDEAKRILKKYAPSVKTMEQISKNVWAVLNTIATIAPEMRNLDPSENQTKKFFEFLKSHGYTTHANAIYGPVINEYLNKKDLKAAVAEFVSVANEHRLTPLQQQLMTLLIDTTNREEMAESFSVTQMEAQELLQKVIEACNKVRGNGSTNLVFIVAVMEAGTEKQLRRVLLDPNIRFNPEMLRKQCDYLNALGKQDTLMKLAKCSRGLPHVQEQLIYNMILDSLIKRNDYQQAINLYDALLKEDDVKVNNEFVRNLADLFRRNNLDLPASLAIHAKQ
ncbi:leucine-rich PPR motif-containing protein, mitochondrial [Culicoides brevitarsis]|uniref:leucine-rich PPR motif-containing protein, mitochondrial n=1 Tax=Culicoides brevitarsis TaxID=469753 RepID=UPI00307BCB9A